MSMLLFVLTAAQALFAEAEILAGAGAGGGGSAQGTPKMVELIDTIMSIPSCLQVARCHPPPWPQLRLFQDQQSKIDVVNKWIKEHKKYESLDADREEGEKAEDEGKQGPDTAEAADKREEESEEAVEAAEAAEEAVEAADPRLEAIQLRRRRSRGLLRGKRPHRKLREVDPNTQPR